MSPSDYIGEATVSLTNINRIILEIQEGLSDSQLHSVSRLERLNSSSPWNFASYFQDNNSRSQLQMVT